MLPIYASISSSLENEILVYCVVGVPNKESDDDNIKIVGLTVAIDVPESISRRLSSSTCSGCDIVTPKSNSHAVLVPSFARLVPPCSPPKVISVAHTSRHISATQFLLKASNFASAEVCAASTILLPDNPLA
ncbi:unnamed protein product [Arabidopsis arenosa]|uniref:Uncharacterized protein n=1 Tax=Arabidopsis arenosa TaxID=38785 RepID=A0A8S2ANL0_ARAAE|nr:unnamed protein product [Arabidopsis arenosa]